MTNGHAEHFAKVMFRLAEAFAHRDNISKGTVDVYFEGLADLEFEAVMRAAAVWIKTGKYFPKIAELRELAGAGVASPEARATELWTTLQAALKQFGRYQSVYIEDGRIAQLVLQVFGSWTSAAEAFDGADPAWHHRKAFFSLWDSISRRQPKPLAGNYLAGQLEASNSARLFQVTKDQSPFYTQHIGVWRLDDTLARLPSLFDSSTGRCAIDPATIQEHLHDGAVTHRRSLESPAPDAAGTDERRALPAGERA